MIPQQDNYKLDLPLDQESAETGFEIIESEKKGADSSREGRMNLCRSVSELCSSSVLKTGLLIASVRQVAAQAFPDEMCNETIAVLQANVTSLQEEVLKYQSDLLDCQDDLLDCQNDLRFLKGFLMCVGIFSCVMCFCGAQSSGRNR